MPNLLAVLLAAMLLAAGPATAKSDKSDKVKPGKPHGGTDISVDLSIVFGADETRIIRDYFHAHPFDAKPLPPGIAKNLARGKPLPPGIAKRYLPGDLLGRLPDRHGYLRIIAGDNVLLVDASTEIIVDVLKDVF